MKVSVVIPVYNVKPYLERCVRSVMQQTFKDLEIILVDDGSTDGSGQLCDKIAVEDKRIQVIHQENQGLSAARNRGIRQATGKYIVFMDSDDVWLIEDGLSKLLHTDHSVEDLIIFKNVHIWKNERYDYTKDYDLEHLSRFSNAQATFAFLVKSQQFRMSACFLLVRRQLLIDHEIYFPVGLISEDIPWSIHLWQHVSSVSFHNLDFYGYYHRADSLSTVASIRVYDSYDKIFSYWKEQCDKDCINKEAIRSYLADMWVNRGYNYLSLKDIDRPKALQILNRHVDLLKYATAPKAKRTAWMVKFVGIKCTVTILGIYWYLRTITKKHVA